MAAESAPKPEEAKETSTARRRRWANTAEAAAYVRLDPEVLRRMNRKRSKYPWLPKPRPIGKDYRWDLDEFDAAMDSLLDPDLGSD